MKLRVLEHSIRMRLTEEELSTLGKKDRLENQTIFPLNALKYELKIGEDWQASFNGTYISISIPKKEAQKLISGDKISLKHTFDINKETTLDLFVEKDVQVLRKKDRKK